MITERSGLNIQLIETGSREEYRRLAKSGKTDIRFDARYDYAEAEAMGCRLTAPYLDASVTRLYKRGGDGFSSAALLKDSEDVYKRQPDTRPAPSSPPRGTRFSAAGWPWPPSRMSGRSLCVRIPSGKVTF